MKIGDWVFDKHGNVGVIRRMGLQIDEHAVEVWWHFIQENQMRNPFVKQKYLTVVTKEVADVMRS